MNADNSLVTKVTDPTGQAVSYTYDNANRVTKVEANLGTDKVTNAYTYASDRLSTVSHNTDSDTCDVTYSFEYDALGRKAKVSVGEQALSESVYEEDRWGNLSEVQYGNGGKMKYAYDDFGRLTGMGYDDGSADRFTYQYGANGQTALVTDSFLGRIHQTEYDLAERPIQHT